MPNSVIDHGDRIVVNTPFRQSVLAKDHLFGTAFGDHARAVAIAVGNEARSTMERNRAEYPPIQTRQNNRQHFLPGTAKALRDLQRNLTDHKAKLDEIKRIALAPAGQIGEGRMAISLQMLRGLKQGDIIQLMLKDRDIAAITLQNYDLLGLPAAARAQLEADAMRSNIERNFARTVASAPTLDDPLGERVNADQAAELADAEIRKMDDLRSDIQSGVRWFRDVVSHAAFMSDVSDADVWAMVQAA